MRGQCGRRRRVLVAAFVMGAALAANAPTVHAHAVLDSSSPADGATLHTGPSRLELHFNEAVLAEATRMELRDGDGLAVHGVGRVVLDEEAENVTATLPRLQPDAYRVDWRSVSADDLHPVSGTVVFGVQRSVLGSGSANAPAPPAAEVGLRAVDLIASVGLVGALVVWIWVLPPFVPWVRRRHGEDSVVMLGHLDRLCLGLATAMSIGCLAASTTLAAVEIAPRTGSGIGRAWTLLHTSASGPWIVMRTLTIAAAVALLLRERRRRGRSPVAERPIGGRPGLLVFVTFMALTFDAQTSHLAGTGLTTTVVTVHRIAASVWIGGVGVLAGCCCRESLASTAWRGGNSFGHSAHLPRRRRRCWW